MVGLPVPEEGFAYFEVFSLDELARTLRILALALAGAALVTTAAGAVIGRWASGRALRPLDEVSKAAETIAGGHLHVRLVAAADPDLLGPGRLVQPDGRCPPRAHRAGGSLHFRCQS